MLCLNVGKEETTIAELWTHLTGRERVLKFHLSNLPMIYVAWDDLDERQKGIVLNAGHICGLDGSRLPDPNSFS
jgi:hypothetical protein